MPTPKSHKTQGQVTRDSVISDPWFLLPKRLKSDFRQP